MPALLKHALQRIPLVFVLPHIHSFLRDEVGAIRSRGHHTPQAGFRSCLGQLLGRGLMRHSVVLILLTLLGLIGGGRLCWGKDRGPGLWSLVPTTGTFRFFHQVLTAIIMGAISGNWNFFKTFGG